MHTRLIALEPLRLALPHEHRLAGQRQRRVWPTWPAEPFIGLRPASALRQADR